MRKLQLTVVCWMLVSIVNAQDLHFSQISQMPLLLNPAATGVMDGWERVSLQHRNQWVGSNGKYNNTMASFDFNVLKSEMNDRGYIGIGGFFFNDVAGDGKIGRQSASLSLSGILPMGRNGHSLSAGLQAGFGSSTLNPNALVFESQWNGTEFDPTVLSGENLNNHFTYPDVGAGVLYQFDGGKSSFFGKNNSKFQLGASVYHVNRPSLKFAAGGTGVLNRKFVFHTMYTKDIADTKIQLELDAAQFIQGKQTETIFGALLKYKIRENGNYLGGQSQIGAGLHMRTFDAMVPSVMILMKGFRFALSYDFTISALRKAQGGGSFELSMSYTNFKDALFKQRRKYKR
jgi:type IX secretion system PorP/SprF family membrane protein